MKKTLVHISRYRVRKFKLPKTFDTLVKDVISATIISECTDPSYEINVFYVDDADIREMNRQHRNIDKATDVLSFPLINFKNAIPPDDIEMERSPETGRILLGDIILSIETANRQAEEYGHSLEREIAFLTVHSVLHLLGYDHMQEDERNIMEDKQRAILDSLLIIR